MGLRVADLFTLGGVGFVAAALLALAPLGCGKKRPFEKASPDPATVGSAEQSGQAEQQANEGTSDGTASSLIPGEASATGVLNIRDGGLVIGPPSTRCGAADQPYCMDAGTTECDPLALPPRSCGKCSVVCGVTEYCSSAGCVQPAATPALVLGARVADFEFDALGSVYLTGSFDQPLDFGSGVVAPGGVSNIFIAKFSTAGSLEWLKTFGIQTFGATTAPASSGIALAVDHQSGNVFVTGRLHGEVDFGGGLIGDTASDVAEVTTLPGNVFVASYSATGSFLWSQLYRSSIEVGINQGTEIVVGEGLVCVAGDGVRGLDLGNGSIGNLQDNRYLFLVAIDKESGAPRWSKGMPFEGDASDSGFARITGLAIDSAERVFVSGWWRGALDLDAGRVQSGRGLNNGNTFLAESGFVASYAGSSGLLRWVRIQADNAVTNTLAIGVDESGSVYAAGHFVLSTDFGGGERQFTSRDDKLFVVAYDGDGNYRFDRFLGGIDGSSITWATGLAVSQGRLYVSAYFDGQVVIEDLPLVSARQGGGRDQPSSFDTLLASYDTSTGEFRWARHFGTNQDDLASQVRMADGTPVIGLQPQGTIDIDGDVIDPVSTSTSVLVRVVDSN